MPFRKVPLVTGQYYHIFNRGVNKQPIFINGSDFRQALESMKFYQFVVSMKFSILKTLTVAERSRLWARLESTSRNVEIVAYCLMPNHYHLLLKQSNHEGLYNFVASWQKSYSRYFNIKYRRIGPLFQGRFKAVRIEDDRQLLHVSRYIHLNPYTSYIVNAAENVVRYRRSSLHEYLYESDERIVTPEIVLNHFRELELYKQFVVDYADYERTLKQIKHLMVE
jgi:putative transposase